MAEGRITRTCNKCHAEKLLAEFELAKRYRGGRMPVCRLCRAAYRKGLAARPKTLTVSKFCNKCRLVKEAGEFVKEKRSLDGLSPKCRSCRAVLRTSEDPLVTRERFLRWKFGITLENYRFLLAKQQGGCAICNRRPPIGKQKYLAVDHDHRTGDIRGLLCSNCNTAIGLLKDDPRIALQAATYLGGSHVRHVQGSTDADAE
jgi:hypothetical protein